jgi:hypothetical protein
MCIARQEISQAFGNSAEARAISKWRFCCTIKLRRSLRAATRTASPLARCEFRMISPADSGGRPLPFCSRFRWDDALSALRLGQSTCNPKHRFLAALAHECGQNETALTLGLYEMSDRNTPGLRSSAIAKLSTRSEDSIDLFLAE